VATDYDAPRVTPESDADESLEDLKSRRSNDAATAVIDIDESDVDSFDLPDADLTGEELTVRVVPKQTDEFVCSSCFLVFHHSRLALGKDGKQFCVDCA
jgi:hypothetical protein